MARTGFGSGFWSSLFMRGVAESKAVYPPCPGVQASRVWSGVDAMAEGGGKSN